MYKSLEFPQNQIRRVNRSNPRISVRLQSLKNKETPLVV
jgi:hypothetical protein